MQVSINKGDILCEEEFFLEERPLVVRVTDIYNHTVKYKTRAQAVDKFNYLIKTRGVYKGGYVATYRLPTAIGTLEDMFGVVGENLGLIIRRLIEKDRPAIARIKRFQTEG